MTRNAFNDSLVQKKSIVQMQLKQTSLQNNENLAKSYNLQFFFQSIIRMPDVPKSF